MAIVATIKFDKNFAKNLEKKLLDDINKQQRRNPVLESDSQAERDRKVKKWIKDAGYGKR